MILLNAAQSRELDRLSQQRYGIDSYLLMTRAGERVVDALVEQFSEAASDVLVVAGKGNNGGDGFVAARRLLDEGFSARVVLLADVADLKGDAARACRDFRDRGGKIVEAHDDSALDAGFKPPPSAVIDAIFGTGLNAEVRGVALGAISKMNSLGVPIVAVDISSGVNSDTGAVMGVAVQAAMTVTFGFAKFGHVSYPGGGLCGDLKVVDIGFAKGAIDEIAVSGRFVEVGDVRHLLHRRVDNSHKGLYGHPLVIAGSRGKSGAVLLASRAALRTGAGLVTAATPQSVQPIVAAGQAELMTEAIADRDGHFDGTHATEALKMIVRGKDSLVVGPGMGMNDDSKLLIEWLITEASEPRLPILIDADGLNALAELGCDLARRARGPIVLTPHPGEASRLLGVTTAVVNSDRVSAARKIAERTGACVLVKGARSVVASPEGIVLINSTGNPGMATPGMGDALSGIVGTLLAQSRSQSDSQARTPLDALVLGVFLHGYAADRVAARIGHVGFIAGDLIDELPAAIEAIAP